LQLESGQSKLKGDAAMMRSMTITLAIGATLTLGACADNSMFGESALQPTAALPAKPRVDPACQALSTRIETLRRDGVVERAEAVSKGKGSSVKVKRASLAQLAELDKANAEFQSKCSTMPRAATVPTPRQVAHTADAKADAVIAKAEQAAAAKAQSKQ
jgi:hypothetical protein